jgi:hypothetical protein
MGKFNRGGVQPDVFSAVSTQATPTGQTFEGAPGTPAPTRSPSCSSWRSASCSRPGARCRASRRCLVTATSGSPAATPTWRAN